MVASYIGAAYWLTASTSFANPAALFGRMLSAGFAGIAPASAPGFVIAELVGAAVALGREPRAIRRETGSHYPP
jgi:F0F1-type ATP synthase membrane subunit c/vacuolar-type H+-ATPase subunit K